MSSSPQQQLAAPTTTNQQPEITDVFSKQDGSNDLWLKVFLIDSSLNQNQWKLKDEFIAKNVQNFVGKPLILTANKAHPDFVKEGVVFGKGQETLDQILTAQSKYQIGEIKQVERDPKNQKNWNAYIQITNPKIIESFKAGNIPKFVSPAIYDPTGEPDGTKVKDFTPIHIAAVDEPAYGLKAYVKGACDGDGEKCVNELKTAAAQPKNPDCPCSILETFTNKLHSSYLKNASLLKDSLSQLEKPDTFTAEITPQIETSKLESTSDTTPNPTPVQQAPSTPNVEAPQPTTEAETQVEKRGRKAALEGEVESLKQQLSQVLEWQKGEQEKAVKAAAEAQRATIEAAITPQVVGGDDAKRQQVIENLVGLNFSNEQLNFVLSLISGNNKNDAPQKEEKQQPPNQFQRGNVKSASVNTLVLNQKTPEIKKSTYFSSGFFGDL